MKASDFIAAALAAQGVTAVYELTGGMITHVLDSIYQRGDIRIISVHHEQAAAFAAEGGARMTGVPGVALATSGPGATNLLTGIGSCYFDSVPAVFITGQVNTNELRAETGVRQAGFQETDIVAVASPLTKAAWQVSSTDDLPEALTAAFELSVAGRPGPVLIDIPMDVQRADVSAAPSGPAAAHGPSAPPTDSIIDALIAAEKPLVLAGGGVRAALAAPALRRFVEASGLPVVSTLMGLDVLPYAHQQRVGFIGTYGNRWANLALRDSDCLLVLGARLDVRQTGADTEAFHAGKTLIQVDIDAAELSWRVPPDVSVQADIGAFLEAATRAASQRAWPDRAAWRGVIEGYRRTWPDRDELADLPGINPAAVMHRLSEVAGAASAFVVDVGQNQMWAAQSLRLGEGQRFLTSGGMGSMGFALPAAIGVSVAVPGRPVVAISGDGGLQVNIQELETIARLGLPIKTVVLNNGCLGMVRQFQDENFDSRYQSTVWGYGAPDFVRVADAYGVTARRVEHPRQLAQATRWLMRDEAPALLEIALHTSSCVRPKVSFGNPVYVMDPPPSEAAGR